MNEEDHVGILFNRAGFAKVRKNRPLVTPGFHGAVQLR